jgi:rare lipoprotein A
VAVGPRGRALEAVGLSLLVALAACAHRQAGPGEGAPGVPSVPHGPPPPGPGAEVTPPRPPRVEEGLASYYGRRFQGRRTASGQRYDAEALTCAHRTLPFGTRLRITDLESGRSVEVTVNDRGPAVRGRVVDVSLAAARALDLLKRGVTRVRVEPL